MDNEPTPTGKKSGNFYKWLAGGLFALVVISVAAAQGGTSTNAQPAVAQETQQQAAQAPTSPTTPPPSVFSTYLALGSSGTAVANLQQFLNDVGLYSGSDTGYFGTATQAAVVAFQRQQGITPANGVFGATTQAQANVVIASHPDWITYISNNSKPYTNVNGSTVQPPSYSSNGIPAGASAVCGDGTYSFSMHRSGTCSHHGGVSQWLQ